MDSREQVLTWRSPISGSHGFVTKISDGNKEFYVCSESGAVWFHKSNLFEDIEKVVAKYAHRIFFYKKVKEEWYPVADEPDDIDDLIDIEDVESLDDYVRG